MKRAVESERLTPFPAGSFHEKVKRPEEVCETPKFPEFIAIAVGPKEAMLSYLRSDEFQLILPCMERSLRNAVTLTGTSTERLQVAEILGIIRLTVSANCTKTESLALQPEEFVTFTR
jgi:hypothetical protein